MKSYTHFTLSERECLYNGLKNKKSFRDIAKEIGKKVSSVSREYKRNHNKDGSYNPWRATVQYIVRRKRSKRKYKIRKETPLYKYVTEKLQTEWSPEQISNRGKREGHNVSFSTIYRAVYEKRLDGITKETHLRRRGKRKTPKINNFNTIHPEHTIHERPSIVEERGRFGDWEGDTMYGGVGKGCLVTYADRKGRVLTAAVALSRNKEVIRESTKKAFDYIQTKISDMPVHTITFDNGSEFAAFKEMEKDLDATIYFADPHSPWQRGLNENMNDVLRFFFPKGTDFRKVTDEELDSVLSLINNRPRKCLDYLSPFEFVSKKCCT